MADRFSFVYLSLTPTTLQGRCKTGRLRKYLKFGNFVEGVQHGVFVFFEAGEVVN